ncbi:MAG: hypothetical protein HY699_00185 [Deltaproteobacteria bacterium]|nr:hypothetical protein [Deltaproteobacteria bacterium]
MDAPFPFGFPGATAFYLTFYVLTLVIHVLFMNYVLAGTAYLAVVTLFTGGAAAARERSTTALVLRDWMPFALSAAITAGVAPLLFVQILYQRQFYSANLLLFHRWMAMLPVLIVGFYLLYLLKSRRIGEWAAAARAALGGGAWLCFVFAGYSWTENHLLSTHERVWAGFYASGAQIYRSPELLPRLAVWFVGAIPTLAVLVAWQLWLRQRAGRRLPHAELSRLALLAVGGLVLSAACGGLYYLTMEEAARRQLTGALASPYLVAAVFGLVLQVVAWVAQWRRPWVSVVWLGVASIGVLITVVGVTVVREAIRLSAVDIGALYEQHARAAAVGGLPVFLVCFVINAALIAWCIALAQGRRRTSAAR